MCDSSCATSHLAPSTSYKYGCRCDRCLAWYKSTHVAPTVTEGCAFSERKASSAYRHGCRCSRCKEWKRSYSENYRKLPDLPDVKACKSCGGEYQPTTRRQMHCSKTCRAKLIYVLSGQSQTAAMQAAGCEMCGKPHCRPGSKYNICVECSKELARARSRRKNARQYADRKRREALFSSKPFGPFVSDLSVENIGPLHGPSLDDVVAPCDFCGLINFSKHGRWCSNTCYNLGLGRRALSCELDVGMCRSCGTSYARRRYHSSVDGMCSSRCATKERRRRNQRLRRALQRAGDDYTLREIAERDGWRCHLCQRQVPDRPYKARPNDATIDHLIPVSAGGQDVRTNVALAHNECNSKRSNLGPAQLRLVG